MSNASRAAAIMEQNAMRAPEAQVYATLALVEAQERTAKALELIAGPKGILGVERS